MLRAIKRFFTTPRRSIQLGAMAGFSTLRVSESDWLDELWDAANSRESNIASFRRQGVDEGTIRHYMRKCPPLILTIDKHGFHQLVEQPELVYA